MLERLSLTVLSFLGLLAGLILGASALGATHTTYTSSDKNFWAYSEVQTRDGFNGYRVYLSSPTHTNSGSRGELGWDENLNGRHWNVLAADTEYRNGTYNTGRYRNFRARGYSTKVSQNEKNGDFMDHVTRANSWGADVYLVTHTNAGGGDYFLSLVDDNSSALDQQLQDELDFLGNQVPGSNPRQGTDNSGWTSNRNLGELSSSNGADYVVYVEVIFHDNADHIAWFGSGSNWKGPTYNTWRYGRAVDVTLGYP